MSDIEALVQVSQHFGRDDDWVQGAGGNASVKSGDLITIKSSGWRLSELSATRGLTRVRLAAPDLLALEALAPALRESAYERLVAERTMPGDARPSIELCVHVWGAKFVLHTHPTLVCCFACSREGQAIVAELSVGSPEWSCIPYYQPGIALSMGLLEHLSLGLDRGVSPITIFLNHGLMVSAESTDEIVRWSQGLEELLTARCRYETWPAGEAPRPCSSAIATAAAIVGQRSYATYAVQHPVMAHWSRPQFEALLHDWRALYPDAVVYLGRAVLMLNAGSVATIVDQIQRFVVEWGHLPKILFDGRSCYALATTPSEAAHSAEVFYHHLKVLAGIQRNGWTPVFLSRADEEALLHWDAEQYRQRLCATA